MKRDRGNRRERRSVYLLCERSPVRRRGQKRSPNRRRTSSARTHINTGGWMEGKAADEKTWLTCDLCLVRAYTCGRVMKRMSECVRTEKREWMMTGLLPWETGWWHQMLFRSFGKSCGDEGRGEGQGPVWWLGDGSELGVLCNLQPPGGLRDLLVWINAEGRPEFTFALWSWARLTQSKSSFVHVSKRRSKRRVAGRQPVCVCGKARKGGASICTGQRQQREHVFEGMFVVITKRLLLARTVGTHMCLCERVVGFIRYLKAK